MQILRRVEKLRRLLRWRFGSGLPLWWHVGRPNFGDDINPTLFGQVTHRPLRFAADRGRLHLLGAGSILAKATPASVVCGAGFLEPPGKTGLTAAAVVAVRGECSLAALGCGGDVALGDPVTLVDELVEPGPKRHRVGLVPHVLSVSRWRAQATAGLHVIDPGRDPWWVVREIAACETVFSQSLHGLIVADALGVPNVWIAPSDQMVGGRFKFDDYFSTLDHPKECVPEGPALFTAPGRLSASVATFRYSKATLRKALAAACDQLLH